MGKITGQNIQFKSALPLFSKIKRTLKSFAGVNLIDDSDFPEYVSKVLKDLGVGANMEADAVLKVCNYKAQLPKDLKQFYSIYKLQGCDSSYSGGKHLQNKTVFENDITCEVLTQSKDCKIHCECPDRVIERITVKKYVNDDCFNKCYDSPILLSLSPNVKAHCSDDCISGLPSTCGEVTWENGYLRTNFPNGELYIQYYAFPTDDDNIPMIPDIIQVEDVIVAYIKWQTFMNFWLTDDVSNTLQKMQYLQGEYEKAYSEASYILKLPSFSQIVNSIRNQRSLNKLKFFSQQA